MLKSIKTEADLYFPALLQQTVKIKLINIVTW